MNRRYVTVAAIATKFGVSDKTVRKWIKAGSLRAALILGIWRVRDDDLAAFEAANRFDPDKPAKPAVSP
jgi:excisionase family DNA binding protein